MLTVKKETCCVAIISGWMNGDSVKFKDLKNIPNKIRHITVGSVHATVADIPE